LGGPRYTRRPRGTGSKRGGARANPDFAAKVEQELDEIIKNHCIRVTEKNFHHTLFRQFLQWTAFQVIRFLFFLFTFYFRQEKGVSPIKD